ncbi:MAG: alpha/beta hydrolase family protein [Alcanivoracaceae bacterium]
MLRYRGQPWWRSLPVDYHRRPVETPLDRSHRLHVSASAAVDHVLKNGLATGVLMAMMNNLRQRPLAEQIDEMSLYRDLADRGDPQAVFQPPPDQVEVRISRPRKPIPGVDSRTVRFRTGFEALNPALRDRVAGHAHNQIAEARHWTHPDGPRPTLIFLHGYSLDAYWVNSAMFSLRWFYDQGWDVLLYTLPFHGSRRGRFDPFSGFGFFSHGFAETNETMLQAIHEVRTFMQYLRAEGVATIGISGLSLGGYLSALTAAVEPDLAFVMPNAAVVSPTDMLMEWAPLREAFQRVMPKAGLDLTDIRHATAIHSPLTWRPLVPAERLLIIAGAGDRFTAPRYQQLLHEHWVGSQLHWFPGNHVVHLQQRDYLRLMRTMMRHSLSQEPIA